MGLSRQSRELMHKIYAKINGLSNPWVTKTSKTKHIEVIMPLKDIPKKTMTMPKKIEKVIKPMMKKKITSTPNLKPIKTTKVIKPTKVVKAIKHKK